MRTIEQVNYEIGKLEYKTESLKSDIDNFEYSMTDNELKDLESGDE